MPKKANTANITSYKALMEQVEKLKKQASIVRQTEVKSVVSQIHQQMKQYNISPKDLQLGSIPTSKSATSGKTKSRKKVTPQFKDPITGTTWNGRGRTPKWITSARGKTKADFVIAR